MRVRIKRKGGRAVLVAALCAVLIVSVYLAMLFSTNSLLKYVEQIYRGEISENDKTSWQDTAFDRFDIAAQRPETEKVQADIKRVFVLHNFSRGYVWVYTDCEATDKNGKVTFGFSGYEKWKIENTETGWEILKVKRKA